MFLSLCKNTGSRLEYFFRNSLILFHCLIQNYYTVAALAEVFRVLCFRWAVRHFYASSTQYLYISSMSLRPSFSVMCKPLGASRKRANLSCGTLLLCKCPARKTIIWYLQRNYGQQSTTKNHYIPSFTGKQFMQTISEKAKENWVTPKDL